jgi:hypothetical protein
VTVTGGSFACNGAAHPASATATGVGGAAVGGGITITYNGSMTAPTSAGAYAVVATFASTDPNYNGATGSATITITKLTAQQGGYLGDDGGLGSNKAFRKGHATRRSHAVPGRRLSAAQAASLEEMRERQAQRRRQGSE